MESNSTGDSWKSQVSEVRKMGRGIAYLLAGILLWLVCQISQIFLYEVPSYVLYVGFALAMAGWLISRYGVQWKAPTLVRCWLVGVLGMALMLSGSAIVLGRFLEGTRGSFFSWGLVASLGVAVITISFMSFWVATFPEQYNGFSYWLSAFVLLVMAAIFSGQNVSRLGLVPRAPEISDFSSFWVFLPALIVFYWFHRGLSCPDGRDYEESFDILRGVSGVLIGRDMAWGRNGR